MSQTKGNQRTVYTVNDSYDLYDKSTAKFDECNQLLNEARMIANQARMNVDSNILDSSYQSPFLAVNPLFHPDSNYDVGANADANNANDGDATYNKLQTNPHSSSHHQHHHHQDTAEQNNKLIRLQAFQPVLSTTGGHSNTDHVIQITGDYRSDAIAEYKRKLKRRARAMQPEQRGSDRWDQPRVQGSRRRRIIREKDLPSAPPEPPPSGYVLFIAQMTTKIRHDRPAAHHDQIKVVKEISKIWKFALGDKDREYYNEFAREAREEYELQHEEFRATGAYQPSNVFTRLGSQGHPYPTATAVNIANDTTVNANDHGINHDIDHDHDIYNDVSIAVNGPWVRIAQHEKNALEREISSYDSVKFPPRPDHLQKPSWVTKIEKQNKREKERKHGREERLKKEREKQMQLLKEASVAKMKRLKEGAL